MGSFGVDLDAKMAETDAAQASTPAPSVAPPSSLAPESSGTELGNAKDLGTAPAGSNTPTIQEIVELDKLDRFKWNGREWTPKDLKDAALRQEDYTKKTQEVSEARKYAENFAADLDLVRENPALLSELKKLYPPSYVKVAERVLKHLSTSEPEKPAAAATRVSALDETRVQKLLEEKLNPLLEWKESQDKERHEAQVESRGREIDSWFDKYSKKYSNADLEVINARALSAVEQGVQISEQVIEKLFKAHHEEVEKRYTERYRKQIEEQQKANRSAQDAGPGGGVPGKAPVEVKTMKDARRRMEDDIAAGRIA